MKLRQFLFLCMLSLAAGAFDRICTYVVVSLQLPLFFDTIGCIAVTFCAGPAWGTLSALFSYFLFFIAQTTFSDALTTLFCLCSIAAVFTAWLFKKYVIDRHGNLTITLFAELLILSFFLCIVESISGGLVSMLAAHLDNRSTDRTLQSDFIFFIFHFYIKSPLAAAVISRIPVNVLDRLITVPLAWAAYKGISKCRLTKNPISSIFHTHQ